MARHAISPSVLASLAAHVRNLDNGTWAISARGFNLHSANKLLVMIDGRTVDSPLFAGVFWYMLDYVLEDIDRVEVIRGPGAVLLLQLARIVTPTGETP